MNRQRRSPLVLGSGLLVLTAIAAIALWPRPPMEPAAVKAPKPAAIPPAASAPGSGAVIPSFDVVRADGDGRLTTAGRAAPKADVAVVDGAGVLGHVAANAQGEWLFLPETPLVPGRHELTLVATSPDGTVARSTEPAVVMVRDRPMAAQEAPVAVAASVPPPPDFAVVHPGNSLWRLARRTYGRGMAYVDIFDANRRQIHDPDLIYPGQRLVLPPQ
ncbi:MAG: LysM peptidoglycan-binding domain-containing protein [Magnetospirillum sp.]|nr:LysM peptidoglycan-binding domain-containing protein [Magnetospirillum sp.]